MSPSRPKAVYGLILLVLASCFGAGSGKALREYSRAKAGDGIDPTSRAVAPMDQVVINAKRAS